MSNLIVGIDFDNTLVSYDDIFSKIAMERDLIPADGSIKTKQTIRDYVRANKEQGDVQWQKMQALVYGIRILEAAPSKGVVSFLQRCVAHHVPVFVVSHKTEFATYEEASVNLRKAALKWFEKNDLFSGRYGLSEKNVFFESTRTSKVLRIQDLSCTHFIDDLEETFLEKQFPTDVTKVLYAKQAPGAASLKNMLFFSEWSDIHTHFFESL